MTKPQIFQYVTGCLAAAALVLAKFMDVDLGELEGPLFLAAGVLMPSVTTMLKKTPKEGA